MLEALIDLTEAQASVMAVTRFDFGPAPSRFYARHADGPQDDALEHLLSDLIASQHDNAQPVHVKTERLVLALGTLVLTVVCSAVAIAA